ncbi:MAG TPA: lysophospholipid acyltransferase family protein [Gemmatimonadaceae bacterium]|nr:lysophospholipid acyltransferase family protein [Gemmatimonadaceae bacterium]
MWLYRAMPIIGELATRSYYRVTVSGARVPSTGPVLLVANHNNSLVDPALVAGMADRQVRFLAKAPLFEHPLIGWLVKGVGSVPVYRTQDDPTKVSQNVDSFRDVHRVLAAGDVVGIFPEGISHSAASLAPLKTGAARIAIGASKQIGTDFPIIAMGLVFRDRDRFRSEAHVIIGEAFRWDDLVGDIQDRAAVRELTSRIERAMRAVSVNLQEWEDEPLVRTAEAVWRAEFMQDALDERDDPAAMIRRLQATTQALKALRHGDAAESSWRETAVELRAHGRILSKLGLTAESLVTDVGLGEAVRWFVVRLPFVVVLPISLLVAILFWLPKQATVRVAAWVAAKEGDDALVTHRVLAGALIFPLWFVAVAAAVGARWGWPAAVLALLMQPPWTFAALTIGERRARAWLTMRRYFLRRLERPRLEQLRLRQRELAVRLRTLLTSLED